jgi:hypothetical protein
MWSLNTLLSLILAALICAAPLAGLNPEEVTAYLARLPENDFETRLTRVALDAVGTPYADGPLGEGPDGQYDTDPLIDLSRVDCVTFVEQCIALAASRDYDEAFQRLQRIRYLNGQIDYESRHHFFVTDWLAHHIWCRDISGGLGVETAKVTRTISRRGFFQRVNAPDLGHDTPDREVTLSYVPVEAGKAALAQLPTPSLLVFIGRKPDWLFALHTGFYLRDETGAGRLVHASSKAGAVAAVDLAEYLRENAGRYLGFTAYRVSAPK